ncbi:hypothetical protein TEA_025430 [Camellia sinensis var. sinensis]|uniref:Uncharacterized protein n=1 Tax=Camellia sinensis var. sinensis TaxID=542762 RepID=A0A4S4DMA2_CAMSN|nr:hypothetical protein TEA_025430 [Camellia sinensis var. sinensis]
MAATSDEEMESLLRSFDHIYDLERRTNCQSLKEELERTRIEYLWKENEYMTAMESLQQGCAAKINDLETQIRGFLIQKAADEATIKQLHEDLDLHKIHLESLTSKLEQVHFDVESRYHREIQDLKDCLMAEQEEKNELNKKLQNLDKELLIIRTKLSDHQRDLTSNRQVETLKQKIMKLRKGNEVLQRQLHGLKDG